MGNQERTAEILIKIGKKLPENYADLSPELKMHYLVLSANQVLDPPDDYILIRANMTIKEALSGPPDVSE